MIGIKRFLTNTSALQLFQLLRFGTLLLISVILAKSKMEIAEIGYYERLLFYGSALSFFWVTGLIQALLPLFKNNLAFSGQEGQKSGELFNAAFLLLILSVCTGVAWIVLTGLLDVPHASEFPYSFWLILYVILNGPSLLTEYIYLLLGKPFKILWYGIISYGIQLILVALPALLEKGIENCIAGLLVSLVFRWVWLIVLLNKYSSFKISFPFIREHLNLAYPLMVSSLLAGSAQYIDGLLVNVFYDPAGFAIFRYGARELPLAVMFASALSNSMTARFSSTTLENKLAEIKHKSARLAHFLFPVTIGLLISSYYIYPFVFNPQFVQSAAIFNVYLLLIISRMLFPQTILIGMRKTKWTMLASVIEILVHIALCFLFVQWWGMVGVAFSTLVSSFTEKIVLVYFLKRNFGIAPKAYIPLRLLLLYSGFTILVYLLSNVIITSFIP